MSQKIVLNCQIFSVKSPRDSLADVVDDRCEHRYNEEGDDDHHDDHAFSWLSREKLSSWYCSHLLPS